VLRKPLCEAGGGVVQAAKLAPPEQGKNLRGALVALEVEGIVDIVLERGDLGSEESGLK